CIFCSVVCLRFVCTVAACSVTSTLSLHDALPIFVILIGAEVDAGFERARELEAGKPAEGGLTLDLRESKAAEKAEAKYEDLVDEGPDLRLRTLHRDAAAYTGPESRLTPQHGVEVVGPDAEDDTGRATSS